MLKSMDTLVALCKNRGIIYRATAVIGERAQIDAIAHKCFFFRCVSDVLHHIDDFLGTEESRAGVREPIRRAKRP